MRIIHKTTSGEEKMILTGKDKINAEKVAKGEMFACPQCGKGLDFGTTVCSYCGSLFDEKGNIRTEISDEELTKLIEKGRIEKKKGRKFLILALCFGIAWYFIRIPYLNIALFVAAIVLAIVGLVLQRMTSARFKNQLSQTMIPQILSEVFDDVTYDPAGHISSSIIKNVDMHYNFKFDDMRGSDYIKGKYRGVEVEICDIQLYREEEETETDSDGNTHASRREVTEFTGQWIIFDFKKQLSADLSIFEDGRRRKQIETENTAFNNKYGIICDNPHDAFYILTPHMMEYILEMDRKAGGDTFMRFLKEGKVYLAINSNRNHFEVGNIDNADVNELRQKFKSEIRYVTDLIDTLLSLDTLYKQEEV